MDIYIRVARFVVMKKAAAITATSIYGKTIVLKRHLYCSTQEVLSQ